MRSLSEFLGTDYGLAAALNGWRLEIASAVSGDGRTIAGWGMNPAGQYEAWRVQFVPEPATGLLFFGGIAVLAAARTRRSERCGCATGKQLLALPGRFAGQLPLVE
jgi:hypothetical protein